MKTNFFCFCFFKDYFAQNSDIWYLIVTPAVFASLRVPRQLLKRCTSLYVFNIRNILRSRPRSMNACMLLFWSYLTYRCLTDMVTMSLCCSDISEVYTTYQHNLFRSVGDASNPTLHKDLISILWSCCEFHRSVCAASLNILHLCLIYCATARLFEYLALSTKQVKQY